MGMGGVARAAAAAAGTSRGKPRGKAQGGKARSARASDEQPRDSTLKEEGRADCARWRRRPGREQTTRVAWASQVGLSRPGRAETARAGQARRTLGSWRTGSAMRLAAVRWRRGWVDMAGERGGEGWGDGEGGQASVLVRVREAVEGKGQSQERAARDWGTRSYDGRARRPGSPRPPGTITAAARLDQRSTSSQAGRTSARQRSSSHEQRFQGNEEGAAGAGSSWCCCERGGGAQPARARDGRRPRPRGSHPRSAHKQH